MSGNQFPHLFDYSLHPENFQVTITAGNDITSVSLNLAGGSIIPEEIHWHVLVHSISGGAQLRLDVEDSADGSNFAPLFQSVLIDPVAVNSYYARMNREASSVARPFVQFRANVVGGTNLVLSSTSVRSGYSAAPQNGVHVFKNAVFGASLDGFGPYEKDANGNEHVLGDYPASVGL